MKKSDIISKIKKQNINDLHAKSFLPLSKTWDYKYHLHGKDIISYLNNNILNEEFVNVKDDMIYTKIYDKIDTIDIPNSIFLNFIKKNKRNFFPNIYLADFNHFEYIMYLINETNNEKIDNLFDLVNIFYLLENYTYLDNAIKNGCMSCNDNPNKKLLVPKTIIESLGGGEELNINYKKELLDKIIFKAITKRDDEYINK